jgi:hypothetical protein
MSPMTAATERTARAFREMARREMTSLSPLYERLTLAAADRSDILDIMQVVPDRLRLPHLFLAAVQFLLARDGDAGSGLAAFYPNLAAGPTATGDPAPALSAFCREHNAKLRQLVGDRRVQTNEVRRSTSVALALAQTGLPGPISLVELGCSAGLNLYPDRYRYRFGDASEIGETGSPVLLEVEFRGATKPPIPASLLKIARRTGIDRAPLDLNSADDFDWLLACVWPEHKERQQRLVAAREHVRHTERDLRTGGINEVAQALNAPDEDESPVLLTTHTVTYFSPAERRQLLDTIACAGREQDLDWVLLEGPRVIADLTGLAAHPRFAPESAKGFVYLALVSYRDGRKTERLLARCSNHAEWIEWLGG